MNPAVPAGAAESDLDPILVGLVDEFSRRVENGEEIVVEEFASLHPLHAERLCALLPAIRGLAALGRSGTTNVAFSSDLREGSQLGDFRILREVGRGGMGVVYEAFQASLGRAVALKVLSLRGDAKFLERFQREAQVVARLHHTNIVPVFGIGEEHGVHFYAMQFIHGRNLDDLLRAIRPDREETTAAIRPRAESTVAAVSPALEAGATGAVRLADLRAPGSLTYYRAVAALGVQAAQGLAHAHGLGVLHRDVKPSNLLLDGSGIVRLTDFGLAKLEGDASLTHTGDVVGTLRYMAPERFEGRCDVRSDVYGLGMTLYELLTLRPAFDAPDRARLVDRLRNGAPPAPRTICPDLHRDLETIVLKAIDPIPAARYPTADDLADDLQRYLENRPIAARPPSWWDRANKWARRRPAIAALGALLMLAVTTLLAVWVAYSLNLRTALDDKGKALVEKQEQWENAENARTEAESGQYRALLGEAQALRLAARAGWRKHAIANLEKLAHSNAAEKDVVALRTEAVACLTAPDLQREPSLPISEPSPTIFRPEDDPLMSGLLRTPDVWLAFSPDGSKMAVRNSYGQVIVHDARTLKPLRTIAAASPGDRSRDSRVHSLVQFHPSGDYLAVADGKTVRLAPLDEAAPEPPSFKAQSDVDAVGFTRDGVNLVVVDTSQQITVREALSGRLIRTIDASMWGHKPLVLSPDAEHVALVDSQHDVIMHSLEPDGAFFVLGQHKAVISDLVFSPDGGQVLSSSLDGTVRRWTWDAASGTTTELDLWTIPPGSSQRLTLSPDGRFLVLVNQAPLGSVTLREAIGGSAPLATYSLADAEGGRFTGKAAFSPAGDRILVGRHIIRRDSKVSAFLDVFRVEGRHERRRLLGLSSSVLAMAFHPQRPLAATVELASETGLTFWDLEQCRPVRLWTDQTVGRYTPLAFSPDGTLLASLLTSQANEPKPLGLRDIETGIIRQRPSAVPNARDVLFSPSGKLLGATTYDRRPFKCLIDLATDRDLLASEPVRDSNFRKTVRFLDDGRLVATWSSTEPVTLYDATGIKQQEIEVKHLVNVQLSGDGRLLIGFNAESNQLLLYQFPEMRQVAASPPWSPQANPPRVFGFPFSADNRYVVTVDKLQTAQLRRGRTLELLFALPSQGKILTDTLFSPKDLLAIREAGLGPNVTLHDLPAIRRGLAELGLDWSDDGE